MRDRTAEGGAGGGPGLRDESRGGGDPMPSGDRGEWGSDRLSLGGRAEAAVAGDREEVGDFRGGVPPPPGNSRKVCNHLILNDLGYRLFRSYDITKDLEEYMTK